MYNDVNRGDEGDPYPGSSGNHELDNASNPNTKFDDGTPSNLDVHIDSTTCATTMQLDVTRRASPRRRRCRRPTTTTRRPR